MKRFPMTWRSGLLLSAMMVCSAGYAAHGTELYADSGAMTGAYYMRDTLVPRVDDLALIQRKPALYLASFNDGMATVAYSLADGRLVYRVVQGAIGDAARADIDRALVRLQRKLV